MFFLVIGLEKSYQSFLGYDDYYIELQLRRLIILLLMLRNK